MPVSSSYPSFEVPNLDLWNFLFERKDKPYPDDKSTLYLLPAVNLADRFKLSSRMLKQSDTTPIAL